MEPCSLQHTTIQGDMGMLATPVFLQTVVVLGGCTCTQGVYTECQGRGRLAVVITTPLSVLFQP